MFELFIEDATPVFIIAVLQVHNIANLRSAVHV